MHFGRWGKVTNKHKLVYVVYCSLALLAGTQNE